MPKKEFRIPVLIKQQAYSLQHCKNGTLFFKYFFRSFNKNSEYLSGSQWLLTNTNYSNNQNSLSKKKMLSWEKNIWICIEICDSDVCDSIDKDGLVKLRSIGNVFFFTLFSTY